MLLLVGWSAYKYRKTVFGDVLCDFPRPVSWGCIIVMMYKLCLSYIKLICDVWSPAQVFYKWELDVGVLAELRHLSLTNPCPVEAWSLPRNLELPGRKIPVSWKWKKGLLFLSCSLISLPSLAYLPSARTENFLFSYFFWSCKFSCCFFLCVTFSCLDLAVFMPVNN